MDIGRLGSTLMAAQILLACATGAAAQADDGGNEGPADGVVASLGFGAGSGGTGGQLSIWAQLGGHSVGFRTASTFNFDIFEPTDSDEDYAVLYGRRSAAGRTWGRVGVGPALVRTIRPGDPIDCFIFCTYETLRESTMGIAFQADGVVAVSGPVGLGVTAFANLNSLSSFAGVTLNVVVGRVGS